MRNNRSQGRDDKENHTSRERSLQSQGDKNTINTPVEQILCIN